jgi:hypothetical protein
MNRDRVIGPRVSADGVGRPVYEGAAGRRYVVGPDGEPL